MARATTRQSLALSVPQFEDGLTDSITKIESVAQERMCERRV